MGSRSGGISTSSPTRGTSRTPTQQSCASVAPMAETRAASKPAARLSSPAPSVVVQPTSFPLSSSDTAHTVGSSAPRRHRHCAVPRLPVRGPRPPNLPRVTPAATEVSEKPGPSLSLKTQSAVCPRRPVAPYTLPGRGTQKGSANVAASNNVGVAQRTVTTGPSVTPPQRLERVSLAYTAQPSCVRAPVDPAPLPTDVVPAGSPGAAARVQSTPRLANVAEPSLGEPHAGADTEESKRLYAKSLLLPELFNDLAAGILHEKPADMVEYTLQWLKARRRHLETE